MNRDHLDEREFELINIIGARLGANQRDLSRMMDLSLGMTNMLLKRLIAKGYIRMQQVNKRKVDYILTSKGFSEKMQKTLKYALKTINSFALIKEECARIIRHYINEGHTQFYLYGNSDLIELVDIIFNYPEFHHCAVKRIDDLSASCEDGLVLVCMEGAPDIFPQANHIVDFVEELSKTNMFLEHQVQMT